jgi:hypothetical protein
LILQRIDDPVAGEGVHLKPKLVGREHLLPVHVDAEYPLVDHTICSMKGMRRQDPHLSGPKFCVG